MCNENGNCHCNPGWLCPNCTEADDGPGDSIDSGLKCQVPTAKRTITPAPKTTTKVTITTNEEKNFINDRIIPVILAVCFLIFLGAGICCCTRQCRSQLINGGGNHNQVNQGSHGMHFLRK